MRDRPLPSVPSPLLDREGDGKSGGLSLSRFLFVERRRFGFAGLPRRLIFPANPASMPA